MLRVHVDGHPQTGSVVTYRRLLADGILPAFGDRDFRSIKRADIQELHATMKSRPGAANNMVCVISSPYTWIIEDWELSDMRNPAQGIRQFAMQKRNRFLTPEEWQRVHAVIQIPAGRRGHIKLASVWALDLLALTGRRRNEILADDRLAALSPQLPDTKTGHLDVPVSAHVLGLLKHIHEQTGSPRTGYVLRTPNGTRLRSINRTWENIRAAAGLNDVRLHDLRHSFASDALMSGVPLAVVGELLGHKTTRTTQRYAHLANHVVRQALEVATSRIVAAVTPVAALAPPRFEPMRDAQWKAIAAIVESTRGRCGGPRTAGRSTRAAGSFIPAPSGANSRPSTGRRRHPGGGTSAGAAMARGSRSRPPWTCAPHLC